MITLCFFFLFSLSLSSFLFIAVLLHLVTMAKKTDIHVSRKLETRRKKVLDKEKKRKREKRWWDYSQWSTNREATERRVHNVNETISPPALPLRCTCEYFSICIVKYRYSRGICPTTFASPSLPLSFQPRNLRRDSPYKTELRQFYSSLPFSLFPVADFGKVVRGWNFNVTSIQCPVPPAASTISSFEPASSFSFVHSVAYND